MRSQSTQSCHRSLCPTFRRTDPARLGWGALNPASSPSPQLTAEANEHRQESLGILPNSLPSHTFQQPKLWAELLETTFSTQQRSSGAGKSSSVPQLGSGGAAEQQLHRQHIPRLWKPTDAKVLTAERIQSGYSLGENVNPAILHPKSFLFPAEGKEGRIHTATMRKSSQHQALVKNLTKP